MSISFCKQCGGEFDLVKPTGTFKDMFCCKDCEIEYCFDGDDSEESFVPIKNKNRIPSKE